MKKSTKIALIVAGGCVALGIILCAVGLVLIGDDIMRINEKSFSRTTHEVEEEIHRISVEEIECDVYILASSDGTRRVECSDSERMFSEVNVNDGTLTVKRIDERRWYEHIGIWWERMPTLNIYLPEGEYESLDILTASGDVEIPSSLSFEKASIKTTSGDISSFCKVTDGFSAESTSGDVSLGRIEGGTVEVTTTSGEIDISDVNEADLSVKTTSGDIELCRVVAVGVMRVSSVSGDVDIEASDAASLEIDTTSGDVEAVLLTAKKFVTDTVSGDVSVPDSDSTAGKCSVTTTSGDILIRIE